MNMTDSSPTSKANRAQAQPVFDHDHTMTSTHTVPVSVAHDHSVDELPVARAAAVIALGGVALIHLLEVQHKFAEVRYLGVGYFGLIVGCIVAGGLLVHRNSRTGWILGGGVAAATLIGYALTRTVGLPQSTDDIGNWLEPMGLASLFVEGIVVLLATYAIAATSSASTVQARARTGTARTSTAR
jgi:hypothetical protein